MKFLLVAINAKYIHSNLGVFSLKSYAEKMLAHQDLFLMSQIEIGEYTINHQKEYVLQDIYNKKPDVIGVSCYIWNIRFVVELISDLKKVLPDVPIWLGGPEVTYHSTNFLAKHPQVSGIMRGEGEETFTELVQHYLAGNHQWQDIYGLTYRTEDGEVLSNSDRGIMDMSQLPFTYQNLTDFKHRIIYYESSRGCPFSCSYCLSSVEKSVRFRDLKLVKKELEFFLEQQVPQVKFVDRTFNCNRHHTIEIWKHLLAHDNGVTNFHFEISADLLREQELELIRQMRPGLIQLEIGVQSTNPETITEIHRTMNLPGLKQVVEQINSYQNVHQHLDLIAGLPFETYEIFKQSFNEVYEMKPDQLQLGFLKVLKGSYLESMASTYEIQYQSQPPYEVLSTKWLNYSAIIKLKAIEEMVEVYYNSGQFRSTLAQLVGAFATPFEMFETLAGHYQSNQLFGINHNRLKRYEILYQLLNHLGLDGDQYADLLMQDLYLRENLKSRPSFASDQRDYKDGIKEFFIREAANPQHLIGYDEYDSRQISKMAHIEVMRDGRWLLFDYLNRNALDHNAGVIDLTR